MRSRMRFFSHVSLDFFFFQAEDGIRDYKVTGVQTCALPILAQVGRAIAWIGKTFRERFTIERLAAEVGMSPSSLHEHFRAVTAMTPLQFQKQDRKSVV